MRSVIFALALLASIGAAGDVITPAQAEPETATLGDACFDLETTRNMTALFPVSPQAALSEFRAALANGKCVEFDVPEEAEVVGPVDAIPISPFQAIVIMEFKLRTGQTAYSVAILDARSM